MNQLGSLTHCYTLTLKRPTFFNFFLDSDMCISDFTSSLRGALTFMPSYPICYPPFDIIVMSSSNDHDLIRDSTIFPCGDSQLLLGSRRSRRVESLVGPQLVNRIYRVKRLALISLNVMTLENRDRWKRLRHLEFQESFVEVIYFLNGRKRLAFFVSVAAFSKLD